MLDASQMAVLETQLWATETARRIALASFMLFLYDYLITIDKEVQYFWTGIWSMSRFLFFANRYLPFGTLILTLICFYTPNLSLEFCDVAIQTDFCFNVVNMIVIQAILVLRIWYLFPRGRITRSLCVGIFIGCTVATIAVVALVIGDVNRAVKVPGLDIPGCTAPPPANLWQIFIPPFILHTALFIFTGVRAFMAKNPLSQMPLLRRLLFDGGIFYTVVFFTVGFSGVGALLVGAPMVNIPAIYSNFMLSITSVSMSRVMLSIHSLAASLSSDPDWLLGHAELGRLDLKKGAKDGELIVYIDAVEGTDVIEMDGRVRRIIHTSNGSGSSIDSDPRFVV